MQSPNLPASFPRQFAAAVIDFFLVATCTFAIGWFCSRSKPAAALLVIPLAAVPFFYPLVTHARFGKTLGKYLLKIRVARLDGTSIGWNESLRRSAVDGVFQTLWAAGLVV